MLLLCTLLALSSPLLSTGEIDPLTAKEKQRIVDIHNEVRRSLPGKDRTQSVAGHLASNMHEIEWDVKLEQTAIDYANKCLKVHGYDYNARYRNLVFNHYPEFLASIVKREWGLGQNLAGSTAKQKSINSITKLVNGWYKEVQYFNWKTQSCRRGKICGHLQLMLKSDITKIGCAVGMCKKLILVCHYDDALSKGITLYKKGTPCSNCKSRTEECVNGLCRTIAVQKKECKNVKRYEFYCKNALKKIDNYCFPNTIPTSMKSKYEHALYFCARRCGACNVSDECMDESSTCQSISDTDCFNYKKDYYYSCRKRCNFCECSDIKKEKVCKRLKKYNACGQHKNSVYCRKTCGMCGKAVQAQMCVDDDAEFCWNVAMNDQCQDNMDKCRATCGVCGKFNY